MLAAAAKTHYQISFSPNLGGSGLLAYIVVPRQGVSYSAHAWATGGLASKFAVSAANAPVCSMLLAFLSNGSVREYWWLRAEVGAVEDLGHLFTTFKAGRYSARLTRYASSCWTVADWPYCHGLRLPQPVVGW